MAKKIISPEQKLKAVLEVLAEEKTVSAIAADYGVTPKTISNWHKEFTQNAYRAFTVSKDEKAAEAANEELKLEKRRLTEKIGELTMHIEFLKKNL